MSIHSKAILAVSATLLVLVAVLSLALSRVMMSGFSHVEQEEARKNVTRVLDAVEAQLGGIENSLLTWSQWDPTYQFVQDQDPKYVEENVTSTVYAGMKLNFLAIVDRNGAVAFAGGYDLVKKTSLPVPPELLQLLRPGSTLLSGTDTTRAKKGVARLGQGSLLVAAAPTTTTAGTAPALGHVVFARLLDAATTRALAETTHLGVALDPAVLPGGGVEIVPVDEHAIRGVTNLRDIDGRPAVRVTVTMPRDIHEQATRSLWLLIASIAVIGCAFGALMLVVIRVLILRRLLYMSRVVTEMTESLDFSQRLDVHGKDEISALMTSINGMAGAVSEILLETKLNPGE